ncbi:MAG: PaaI family thioesterase, partial [Bacteroidetes bacterium]
MTVEELNRQCTGSFVGLLGIRFTGFTDTEVTAEMEITPQHHQPLGVVHGGALISLAETVGSAGSILLSDPGRQDVFGSVVNSQHLSPARDGVLRAVARLIHRGDFKHVWDVEIRDRDDKLIS